MRRGRTAERSTDFLRSKIIGESGACSDESVTFCDMYNRPQMCHRHIWGGKIAVCIQLRGTFLREKSSPNPSKDRFVKSVPLSADSGLRLCLKNPQARMLDNGHTKSLSKEAYKWSNRVGARCTDHIRPQMQRCSDTNDRMPPF